MWENSTFRSAIILLRSILVTLMVVSSGCGWQHIANPRSAEEVVQWGQWKRQKQRGLSEQVVGKDKAAVLALWGQPDRVNKEIRFPRYYVGYYEDADPKFLQETYEEWVYEFPRKRSSFALPEAAVSVYFKGDAVIFVGL